MKPLGFIIITYNRADDALELLQNISHLADVNNLLEEIVLVNNASTENYDEVRNYIAHSALPIRYFDAPENLGVAKGRNFAFQKSRAPVLIMLDDDAVLQNKNCLSNLVKEFEIKNTTRPKAIVSFKVLYYQTLEMQKNALPHKLFDHYSGKSFFETYYYAGGAHAIKREALNVIGLYPEDFFYGMEEYDLSYRILDAGYSIVYSDQVVMLHKESPAGSKPKKIKVLMMWINKSKVAYRYLPKRYFYSTSFMWSMHYLKQTRFDLSGFLKGWKQVSQMPSTEKRQPISKKTLDYLRSVKARLWY
jgi:GT2 family glycosyltransferase